VNQLLSRLQCVPPFSVFIISQRHRESANMVSEKQILIINPNSTSSMTDALKPLVNALGFKEVRI
jgi:hypothetical protein